MLHKLLDLINQINLRFHTTTLKTPSDAPRSVTSVHNLRVNNEHTYLLTPHRKKVRQSQVFRMYGKLEMYGKAVLFPRACHIESATVRGAI